MSLPLPVYIDDALTSISQCPISQRLFADDKTVAYFLKSNKVSTVVRVICTDSSTLDGW